MPDQIVTYLTELLLGKGLVISIITFLIGQFVKNSTKINNKHIPLIVAVAGAIIGAVTNQWVLHEESIVMAASDGFIIGGFTTWLYELLCKNDKLKEKIGAKVFDELDGQ